MRFRLFIWFVCVFVSVGEKANAQVPQYAFRVSFSDKKGSLKLSDSASFLSTRALTRRAHRGMVVDTLDIPVSPAYLDSVQNITGGSIHLTSRWMNYCVVIVTDSTRIALLNSKLFIKNTNFVAYYPSGGYHRSSGSNPKFNIETNSLTNAGKATDDTKAYYGATYDQTTMVSGTCLHDQGDDGQGMLIAVLDEGFQGVDLHPGFDSLRKTGRIIDTHDFVHQASSVYNIASLHGTEVLSDMAGYEPGVFVGSAPLATYALYVTEDLDSEQPVEMDDMVAGMERADSIGADVISTSLGYDVFDWTSLSYTNIDGKTTVAAKGTNIATQKGMLVVPTAGNDGSTSFYYTLTPGDADSGLTIGAVDINKKIVGFTGHGPNSSGLLKPDVCALGRGTPILTVNSGNYIIGSADGTSLATPIIAGFAACLWQANPYKLPFDIRTAIINSADSISTPGEQRGYGVPDFCKAYKTVGVKNITAPQENTEWLKVSPNPFSGQIHIDLKNTSTEIIYFELADVTGRIVMTYQWFVTTSEQNVNIATPTFLPQGMYFLRAVTDTKSVTLKLIHAAH